MESVFHYFFHKSLRFVPVQSHMNPVNSHPAHSFTISFNNPMSSTYNEVYQPVPLRFQIKILYAFFIISMLSRYLIQHLQFDLITLKTKASSQANKITNRGCE